MKIAIFGTLKPSTSYRDWMHCFRRQFRKTSISEFSITGSNTILNSYVKQYANALTIPVNEYSIDECSDYMRAKATRNNEMIQEADIVVACVDDLRIINSCTVAKVPDGYGNHHWS